MPIHDRPTSKNIISLPAPLISILQNKNYWETLIERKTCRKFLRKNVSLETLSTILYASFGFLKERENGLSKFIPNFLRQRRSSPSGGGLNSSEAHLYVSN